MITSDGLHEFGVAIIDKLGQGVAITDGQEKNVDIYKTETNDNEIKIYLLFDENYAGTMTSFKLKSKTTSKILVEQPDNIEKISKKLLLVTFKITLNERMVIN